MPRTPPKRGRLRAVKTIDSRVTDDLPKTPNADKTWDGPPVQRSKNGRWSGQLNFAGHKHTVGTFDTPYEWGLARDALKLRLRDRQEVGEELVERTPLEHLTIGEFVCARGSREGWPHGFHGRGGKRRRQSTFDHHADQIQPFVARYGDRRLKGGLRRDEVHVWLNQATENQATSAIAMFNDARRIDPSIQSPFEGQSRSRSKGRLDDSYTPDVLTGAEVEQLLACVRATVPAPWALTVEAILEVIARMAARPGEVWAMERELWKPSTRVYYFRHAIGKGGRIEPLGPKTGRRRSALPDSVVEKIERAPRLDERWLLPGKTGGVLYSSKWSADWNAIRRRFTADLPAGHWLRERIALREAERAAEPDPRRRARMPNGQLDVYELKHHALTWMVTPRPQGLGMDPRDASFQAYGHPRSADVIERWYVRQREADTHARILAAFGANVLDLGARRARGE
jgi:hypothetical protein